MGRQDSKLFSPAKGPFTGLPLSCRRLVLHSLVSESLFRVQGQKTKSIRMQRYRAAGFESGGNT